MKSQGFYTSYTSSLLAAMFLLKGIKSGCVQFKITLVNIHVNFIMKCQSFYIFPNVYSTSKAGQL